jgi:phosphoribosylformylglycinamidine synthase
VRVAVILFPGSNDDRDLIGACAGLGAAVEGVWHKEEKLPAGIDGVGIPGGFSYGDYLRPGAMARFSPIMRAVVDAAAQGAPVLGICNGFQVLCEAGLLPGALVRNRDLRFVCEDVTVIAGELGRFGARLAPGAGLRLPIKHGEGAYVPDPARPPRVAFRYQGPNPNGSIEAIAGVVSEAGNVLGLMPHPEHACDPLLGSTDGVALLQGFLAACRGAR